MFSKTFLSLTAVAVSFAPPVHGAGLSGLSLAGLIGKVTCPDGKTTASHPTCCAFHTLRDDLMENLFDEGCSEEVHEALRLVFHDSMSYSPDLERQGKFGGNGADGSPLLFPKEADYAANQGIHGSVEFLMPFYRKHNISAGDLVQFAGAVGLTRCVGAPRLEFLAGRKEATALPPDGLTPSPADSTDFILDRFRDAGGFTPEEVVALLASHSIARADHVDPGLKEAPFDTTPFIFDTQFYLETMLQGVAFPGKGGSAEVKSPLPKAGELRLLSDEEFARDPRTACAWQGFIDDQNRMKEEFREAMKKLAVVGQDTSQMVDCSEALPMVVGGKVSNTAKYPPTKSFKDVVQVCKSQTFPNLATQPGPEKRIPQCEDGSDKCERDDS